MMGNKQFEIVIFLLIVTISLQQASGLICWECTWDSRDSKTNGFCKEPFDTTNITKAQRYWNYKNCTETSNHSVHCRKVIKTEKNATIIARSCFWKPLIAPPEQCYDSFTPPYIHNEACELCESDGCNGAITLQYSFTAIFVIISTIVTMNSHVFHVLH